jgi:hypothetical protein
MSVTCKNLDTYEIDVYVTMYHHNLTSFRPIVGFENSPEYYELLRIQMETYLDNPNYKGQYVKIKYDPEIDIPIKVYKKAPSITDEKEWIKKQNEYISNLSKRDILICTAYTYAGDKFVNNFINGTLDLNVLRQSLTKTNPPVYHQYYEWLNYLYPMFVQISDVYFNDGVYNYQRYLHCLELALTTDIPTWTSIINKYITDYHRIISNAPPLLNPGIVWRGVKSRYMAQRSMYITNRFLSTTYNLETAENFMGEYTDEPARCCLHKIILPAGSRVLCMSSFSYVPYEYEIVLNIYSHFLVGTVDQIEDLITEDDIDEGTTSNNLYVTTSKLIV